MHLKVSLLVKLIKETTSMCTYWYISDRHINIDLRGAAGPSNLLPNVSKSFSLTSLNFLLKKKKEWKMYEKKSNWWPTHKKPKWHLLPFTQVNSPPTSKNIDCKSNLLVWKRPTYSTNFVVSYSELPLVISRSSGYSLGLGKSRVSKTRSCHRIMNDLTQSDFLKTKVTISGNLFSCGLVSHEGGGLNRLRINQTQTFHGQIAFPLGISKMPYKALFLVSLIVW